MRRRRKPVMSLVEMIPVAGCWIWMGAIDAHGYGVVTADTNRLMKAHRYFYETFVGPVGELHVCHRCDVPSCVNPSHLFLGTHADNMLDLKQKGRQARGTRISVAKLTEKDVLAIRAAHESGESQKDIGARFGIDRSNVSFICARKTWSHV